MRLVLLIASFLVFSVRASVHAADGARPFALAVEIFEKMDPALLQSAAQAIQQDGDPAKVKSVVDALEPAFVELRASAGDDISWPDDAITDPPTWAQGVSLLLIGINLRLTDEFGGEIDETIADAIALRESLRPISRGPGTQFWFLASETDVALMQTLALQFGRMTPEQIQQVGQPLPALRTFVESDVEESRLLSTELEASETIPVWVLESAERNEISAAELNQWKTDWSDSTEKQRLIDEFKLYFAVEARLNQTVDDEDQFRRSLADWESTHERESLWLARNTLRSPRFAYTQLFTHSTILDLLSAAVAGTLNDNLEPAAKAIGASVVPNDDARLLVKRIPLGDDPAVLPVGTVVQ